MTGEQSVDGSDAETSQEKTLECPDCGAKPDTYHVNSRFDVVEFYCSEHPHAWALEFDELPPGETWELADEYNGPTLRDRIRGLFGWGDSHD